MSQTTFIVLRLLIIFGKNTLGCLNNPYTTFRKLAVNKTDSSQVVFILLAVVGYFVFASLVRVGLTSPYLLTAKFNSLLLSFAIGFVGIGFLLYIIGRLFGGQGNFPTLFKLWSYTLIPTIIWFSFTSLLYLFLPPPRTVSFLGKLYSVSFITFSMALLFWKLILYYLTLRFGLRLDLFKIGIVSALVTPAVLIYAVLMYRLGIFRIPFL